MMENPKENMFHFGRLPDNPTIEDLMRFSKINLKKKRNKLKFLKHWSRYVSNDIFAEYIAKGLVNIIAKPLNYAELGEKLLFVEPLPEPAGLIHYFNLKYGKNGEDGEE